MMLYLTLGAVVYIAIGIGLFIDHIFEEDQIKVDDLFVLPIFMINWPLFMVIKLFEDKKWFQKVLWKRGDK